MFQQQYLNFLAALILFIVAAMSWRDDKNPRRFTTGLFWGLYGLVFLIGDWTTHLAVGWVGEANAAKTVNIIVGVVVVLMALIAGCGGVKMGSYHKRPESEQRASASRLRNRLFLPALAIPAITVGGILAFNNIPGLQEGLFGPGNHATLVTLFSMALGCLIGWLIALALTRDTPAQSIQETRRLLDAIGWAFILPQILATLGLLFTQAGVGAAISHLVETWLTVDNRLVAVLVFVFGMALLTMVMGNAFAAFPIIAAGVGIPILVQHLGANPAVMAAIGMFSGYCGTLLTPMAANFNLVPAALLELPDRNAVIKAQAPTGAMLLVANVILLYFLAFL
ncbi:hypothetical protein BTJ39_09590 [Izhakiella australiensis]|uniref:Permease n=1 Tax=Izhakiella australiensis TaxID=1926881 RepID=A0A1S8YM19_9GAMM|nr:DUF979 domain-containing protein [Izhakiella australiensis]OON40139.1 hypothetical protein BTJ39_09590 [Izhakiella australiensis]